MRPFSSNRKSNTFRPPDLYEYSIDNYWFRAAGLEDKEINQPLRGNHSADVVIIGGGFTGLSSAYNISSKFPEKKIVILEGARCGYGASGRNGGFCVATDLLDDFNLTDPEVRRDRIDVSFYGIEQIKQVIAEHNVACDFQENGMLGVAFSERQARALEKYATNLRSIGLESTLLQGKELEAEIKSPRVIAGLFTPYGAILNPAKLALEMKRVVEELGVEVRERTVVTRITPGKVNLVDTELGEIRAPVIVLGLNAYSHKLGLFKNRVFPMCTFIIATEPLSPAQWESIGWENKQGLYDERVAFNYSVPTVDGRIVMGGSDFTYYSNDRLSSGNDKTVTRKIKQDLYTTFPQLEGLKIEHSWGGTTAVNLDRTPSVGVMGDYGNIYYGVGYEEGVPSAQTSGRVIAELMAGESNKFTNHYIANRTIPYAGPTYLRGFFVSAYRILMSRFD